MDANPTLDQLEVFLAVVEAGNFSKASRVLNRAQSVVSYTISNLEAQLDVMLFERGAARQPRLTEAGKAMLTDARRIVADLQVMRARAKSLKQGLEAELSLAISVMIPTSILVSELRGFRERFPSVALRLHVGDLGMIMDMVLSGQANIGIGGALPGDEDALMTEKIGHSFMLPVAAPGHALAQAGRPLTLSDVREEVQLVVMDSSGRTKGRDFNVLSYKTWRVGDMATKYQFIKGGLGWGGLPISLAVDDIRRGDLVVLDLEAYEQGIYPIHAMRKASEPPGPAGRWLIDAFQRRLSECPTDHADLTKRRPA